MKKRITIPRRNTSQLLELAHKLRAKHLADGDASPLKVLNWTSINTLIDEARTTEDQAQALRREKLRVYAQRARQMNEVLTMVRSTRDLLTGVYPGQMKELGLWGFDVMETRTTRDDMNEEPLQKAG